MSHALNRSTSSGLDLHVQTVNSHSRFEVDFLRPRRGIATRYLGQLPEERLTGALLDRLTQHVAYNSRIDPKIMSGNITRRGTNSWRLKYDTGRDPETGARQTRFLTVRGTRKDARRKLRAILHDLDEGSYVDPTKDTVAEYLKRWLRDYAKVN